MINVLKFLNKRDLFKIQIRFPRFFSGNDGVYVGFFLFLKKEPPHTLNTVKRNNLFKGYFIRFTILILYALPMLFCIRAVSFYGCLEILYRCRYTASLNAFAVGDNIRNQLHDAQNLWN